MVAERRAAIYSFFRNFSDPSLCITEEIETVNFTPALKESGVRVGHFLLYCLAKASLQVPELRLRVVDGEIVEIKELYASLVVKNPYTDINHNSVLFHDNFVEFIAALQKQEEIAVQTREFLPIAPVFGDVRALNLSVIPWLKVTAIKLPHSSSEASSIPLCTIGRFEAPSPGRLAFHFTPRVHHGLADAYHIHLLAQKFRENIEETSANLQTTLEA